MSTTLEQIQKIIQKAGIDGALSADAIKLFTQKLEENKVMKSRITTLEVNEKTLEERLNETRQEVGRLTSELNMYNQRENDLEEREKEMLRLELTAQYEAERVGDHKEMFNIVFKNMGIRRTVFTSAQEPTGDQYGGTVSTTENKDETVVPE